MPALAAALLLALSALGTGDTLPPITLVDQNGTHVRTDDLGGRGVLLSFVATRQASPTFCPAVTAKFLYLQEHLSPNGYRLVQIARDARADSTRWLRSYASQFGARYADWRFLTGSQADVTRLISALDAGRATNGYEKLYAVSGRGVLLGSLPADDWSPSDALGWAATLGSRSPDSTTYRGQSATSRAPAYSSHLSLHGNGLKRPLDLIEFDQSPAEPFHAYDVDMTKLLHLIVVSDDLREFQHVHPVLGADGHFRLTLAFSRPGLYHIYADATPHGRRNEVFRFDPAVDGNDRGDRPHAVSGDAAHAGPYSVTLSAVRVPARQDVPLLIAIRRAAVPATDLHPYLGAYAHIVAIGISDLSYMHVHPADAMDMAGSGTMSATVAENAMVPATMTAHIMFPRSGLYKLWVQFRGGSGLYTAPFIVRAI